MELRELKIEISEELLETLKQASEKQNISQQKLVRDLIEKALKPEKSSEQNSLPSVALIKGTFKHELTNPALQGNSPTPSHSPDSNLFSNKANPTLPTSSFQHNPTISPEKIRRKKEIEDQMREISLLIDTAENEVKKEEYLQIYAGLAVEMEALF